MAFKRPNQTDDVVTTPDSPEDWNWETVQEESATRVIFDTIGDEFIGQFKGSEHVTPDKSEDVAEEFDLFIFLGTDGERYAVNHSYSLVKAMEKVSFDDWTRIKYTKDLPTKRGLNPMKDFRVDVRRK